MSNSEKVVLITGAAQRIGAEISQHLHQCGFNIIIHYCNSEQAAKDLAKQLNQQRPHSAACLQANLNTVDQIEALATAAEKIWGRIDALVNNASRFYSTPLDKMTEYHWNDLIDSNLKGPLFLSKALSLPLTKQRGCIINIVDIYSERPLSEHSIYSIAKAGVAMMTKTLAQELAPNVRVNGISPGAILWPETNLEENQKASILKKIPLARTGEASDIARTVAFLIEGAPYINGQIIAVDGGRSIDI